MKRAICSGIFFGGSDFVMLFQEKAGFEIAAPKRDKTSMN